MTLLVEVCIKGMLDRSGRMIGDHRDRAGLRDEPTEVVCIIGCISHDDVCRLAVQQGRSLRNIAFLACGKVKANRAAKAAHGHMDLGAQATA